MLSHGVLCFINHRSVIIKQVTGFSCFLFSKIFTGCIPELKPKPGRKFPEVVRSIDVIPRTHNEIHQTYAILARVLEQW